MIRKTPQGKQTGFTLLELMIASTLGLLIGAAVILYIGFASTQDLRLVNEQRGKETLRFSYEYLAEYIRHAGFTGDLSQTPPIYLSDQCSNRPCTQDGNIALSDRLALRMVAGHGNDCQGNPVSVQTPLTNLFYIADDSGTPSLYCRSYDERSNRWLGNAQVIIDGISQMQIQYGIGEQRVERFIPMDQFGTGFDPMDIKAVRIALLAQNPDPEADQEVTIKLLDHPRFTVPAGQQGTVYIGTFPLLNMQE